MRVSVVATGIDVSVTEVGKFCKDNEQVVELNSLTDVAETKALDNNEPLLFESLEIKNNKSSEREASASEDQESIQFINKVESESHELGSDQVLVGRFNKDAGFSEGLSDKDERLTPVTEKKRFGINSLIGKMTNGFGHTHIESNLEDRKEPPMSEISDNTEFADDERIEVPAFLRRQAN